MTEISLDVGFQGLSWFTTAFREIMGETPTAYRDRLRGAPPAMVPGCYTMMWTRKSSFRKPNEPGAHTVRPMITKLSHATIWVLDQDEALTFYRDKLGFEVRTDQTLDSRSAGSRSARPGRTSSSC